MAQPPTIYKPSRLNYVWNYLSSTLDAFKAKLLGYRTYKAFLTQTGTDAPVAAVVENTLGLSLTYEYDGVGTYFIYTNNLIFNSPTETEDGRKVEITMTPTYIIDGVGFDTQFFAYPVFFNVITLNSWTALANADNLLGSFCSTTLEIRVYNK